METFHKYIKPDFETDEPQTCWEIKLLDRGRYIHAIAKPYPYAQHLAH